MAAQRRALPGGEVDGGRISGSRGRPASANTSRSPSSAQGGRAAETGRPGATMRSAAPPAIGNDGDLVAAPGAPQRHPALRHRDLVGAASRGNRTAPSRARLARSATLMLPVDDRGDVRGPRRIAGLETRQRGDDLAADARARRSPAGRTPRPRDVGARGAGVGAARRDDDGLGRRALAAGASATRRRSASAARRPRAGRAERRASRPSRRRRRSRARCLERRQQDHRQRAAEPEAEPDEHAGSGSPRARHAAASA